MKILVTSDIHIEWLSESKLSRFISNIKKENPDIVLVGGDISHTYNTIIKFFTDLRNQLPNTPILGTFGNHDLWIFDYADSVMTSDDKMYKLQQELEKIDVVFNHHAVKSVNGVTFIVNTAWYDYSGIDPDIEQMGLGLPDKDVIAGKKREYINDYRYLNMKQTDVEFAEACHAYLKYHLYTATDDSIVIVTHMPVFESQILRKSKNFRWGWSNAYFCNLTIGKMILNHPNKSKIKYVISGHTHIPLHSNIEGIEVSTLGSDYGNPLYKIIEL